METLVKVWENSKKLWKHSPAAGVSIAFLVISVSGILFLFLNLIEGSSLDLVSFCFPVEPVYITRRDQN